MRINIAIPEEHVSKPVLDGALEAVTRLNESLLEAGATPTDEQLIARGARWQPEPPGQEHFDHGGIIADRGHGDCDDWAPLRAARLRVTGEDPGAVAVVRKSGAKRWHATVMRSDGSEDDPSLDAGMPGRSRDVGTRGPTLPLMQPIQIHGVGDDVGAFIASPQLALRPVRDRMGQLEAWQARADLPWHWGPGNSPADIAMVSLHRSPVSSQAIVGAVLGALQLGEASDQDPEQLSRLAAIAAACEGAEWEEIAGMYGAHHADAASEVVSGFFGKALKKLGRGLGKIAKGVAAPLAKTALSFVPGGALATAAFNAASPALKRSVLKQKHVPRAQRQGVIVAPARNAPLQHSRAAAPAAPAGQNWLPYPYPLPYPVPGWPAPSSSPEPGVAWPRG